jgi:TolB-like protein/tetratricopeptide (TPR) repeat protein
VVAPVENPSVAVLPFDNLSGNPSDQYLSDGMTEEIIGQLARVPGLKVISRRSTEALKGTRLTLRQIADTLGVRHILGGSIQHAGSRIRISVDLIDARTDAHVWASRYDRDLTDVFAVQEEIARQVADSLVRTVGAGTALGHVSRPSKPGAYESYLAGRALFYRRTQEALVGALERFQEAIARDSSYAPAYAGLSSVYQLWVFYAYPGIDFFDAEGRAIAMADRAIALDPDLAEAYAARGRALSRAGAPAEEVAADFARALQLRPNLADAHQWYALFLAREGRHDEAFTESERVLSLDPLAPGVRTAVSNVALGGRRYQEAAAEADRALALEPGLIKAREQRAMGDLLSNNAARCVSQSLGPYVSVQAMCLYTLGKTQEAARIADSLRDMFVAKTVTDSTFTPVTAARGLAEYHAWTGNTRESLAWLERAFAISPEAEDFNVLASGLYDKVRDDARFKAGLKQIQEQVYRRVQAARLAAARQ